MTLEARDRKVIWHPYTQMKTAGRFIPIVKGEGVYLIDEEGNRYIDAISSWWVNIHGHAHPYLAEKAAAQFRELEHVIFAGFTHEPAIELAERILKILPAGFDKVFYSDNGSTAVEVAIKMALQYWYNKGEKKGRVIALENAYHGDTFGAMSVSGRSAFSEPFREQLFAVDFIDTPVPGKEETVLQQMENLLKAGDVAAFIFEPLIQGAGGMLMYSAEVLDQLITLCKKYNVLTIADEVMTGFGRTGKLFASEYLQQQADVICLSKGLTGGSMALSITACSQLIYDAFLSDDKLKTLFHGHSFTANPVACAVSLASLDLVEAPEFKENLSRIQHSHQQFLERISKRSSVLNPRQQGTIVAFDLNTGESTSYFNKIRDRIYDFFLSKKVLLRPLGNTVYIMSPYVITDEQLAEVYAAIEALLDKVERGEGL